MKKEVEKQIISDNEAMLCVAPFSISLCDAANEPIERIQRQSIDELAKWSPYYKQLLEALKGDKKIDK